MCTFALVCAFFLRGQRSNRARGKQNPDGHTVIKAKQTFTCRTSQIITFKGPICKCNRGILVVLTAVATLLALLTLVHYQHVIYYVLYRSKKIYSVIYYTSTVQTKAYELFAKSVSVHSPLSVDPLLNSVNSHFESKMTFRSGGSL